jgi:hypothetical protein
VDISALFGVGGVLVGMTAGWVRGGCGTQQVEALAVSWAKTTTSWRGRGQDGEHPVGDKTGPGPKGYHNTQSHIWLWEFQE